MKILHHGLAAMSVAAIAFSVSAPQMALAHDYDTKTSMHNFADASVVAGASAVLKRMNYGVSTSVETAGLEPGEALTMWWVVFNRPENCSDGECGENDIFNMNADGEFVLNDDGSPPFNWDGIGASKISVNYADGHVIDDSGAASFRGQLPIRDTSRAILGGPGLTDPMGAEIHLVLRSHGQSMSGKVDEMITTINGGCSDDWPNAPCEDVQFAVFKAQEHASVDVAAAPAMPSAMIAADDLEWVEAGPGSPISVSLVWGNPEEGPHGMLFKLPAGFAIPVHTHTNDYNAILLSGTWRHYVEDGEDLELPTGSTVFQPGMEMHGDDCVGDDECIIYGVYSGAGDFIPKE
jgi:quercetin dioxygenase-like cupin family protein